MNSLFLSGIQTHYVFICFTVCILVVLTYLSLELNERHDVIDEYIESFKNIECDVLKEKIYKKDFEWLGYHTLTEAIHEYEWRCEK